MSLDDLSDDPLSDRPILSPAVRDYLDYVDDLIGTPEVYAWAEDTLRGIRTSIHTTGRITDGQRRAVANIVDGAARGDAARERNKSSRRYEGWSR